MIHNHEVDSSSLSRATRLVLKIGKGPCPYRQVRKKTKRGESDNKKGFAAFFGIHTFPPRRPHCKQINLESHSSPPRYYRRKAKPAPHRRKNHAPAARPPHPHFRALRAPRTSRPSRPPCTQKAVRCVRTARKKGPSPRGGEPPKLCYKRKITSRLSCRS